MRKKQKKLPKRPLLRKSKERKRGKRLLKPLLLPKKQKTKQELRLRSQLEKNMLLLLN